MISLLSVDENVFVPHLPQRREWEFTVPAFGFLKAYDVRREFVRRSTTKPMRKRIELMFQVVIVTFTDCLQRVDVATFGEANAHSFISILLLRKIAVGWNAEQVRIGHR